MLFKLADLLADGGGGQRQAVSRSGQAAGTGGGFNAKMALSLGRRLREGAFMAAIVKNGLPHP